MRKKRPEFVAAPEIFYGQEEAEKYTRNRRIIEIQEQMASRCFDLLQIPRSEDFEKEILEKHNEGDDPENDDSEPQKVKIIDDIIFLDDGSSDSEEGGSSTSAEEEEMEEQDDGEKSAYEKFIETGDLSKYYPPTIILDVGSGSGLSSRIVENRNAFCVGVDISMPMLEIAAQREDSFTDLIHLDIGRGLPFRTGVFDGAVSVSCIQWLSYSYKKTEVPYKRMLQFFKTLYKSLGVETRAALQFYPENVQQIDMMNKAYSKAGFSGGIVIDFPNSTKARKFFLALSTSPLPVPKGLGTKKALRQEKIAELLENRRLSSTKRWWGSKKKQRKEKRKVKPPKKSRQWILMKKESQRMKGMKVRPDTKRTGRARPRSFN